ncbi:rhodanese-like domain-containing protein [Paraliobacillus quinghaiensis]|uniref:Rhodanese-like domain-containing protein n=1 Tax=Paraliobacillus quinghaiensis TaxID=470815 RepID=A0A917TG07_9BACI|nr:rhodanese-like domain-containing protein [Paraliobacillus quinghaiensis]GGM19359.1 rhodanese-like domain-containing protein [Paraliobacillus quinghaiensis]
MKEITAEELANKLAANEDVNIIDVREDFEVEEGKIPQAKHIALGEVEARLSELDKDKHYYMVCRSGGRSGNACQFLTQKGFDVTNMVGGMIAWPGEVK